MSKRRDHAPIWARPAPGQRRPKLTREQIAELALAIADAEGFDAVSMRRLATDLDVGTMTLYYYVRTKEDLIDLMDDALMAEVIVPAAELPEGWRAGLAAIARRTRKVFMRHPWAMQSLAGSRLAPNTLKHIEQSLAVMADSPFDPATATAVTSIVDDYVFGHVMRANEKFLIGDATTVRTLNDFMTAQIATGDYPRMKEMIGNELPMTAFARIAQWMSDDKRFDEGLDALLDGIERQLSSRRRRDTPAAWTSRAPRRRRR